MAFLSHTWSLYLFLCPSVCLSFLLCPTPSLFLSFPLPTPLIVSHLQCLWIIICLCACAEDMGRTITCSKCFSTASSQDWKELCDGWGTQSESRVPVSKFQPWLMFRSPACWMQWVAAAGRSAANHARAIDSLGLETGQQCPWPRWSILPVNN